MGRKEVRVPDLGDFADVPVVEVHVAPGAIIALDDSLITLESEKASFDVPASEAGKVVEVLVSVGDRVSQGTPIAIVETGPPTEKADKTAGKLEQASPGARPPAPLTTAKKIEGVPDQTCQVLVLGAGPGGYSAAFRAADLGMSTILVDRWPVLGGVCLNVGCIPSKALLHMAAIIDAARGMASHGVTFAAPSVDLAKLRAHKEAVVRKLTNGLAAM